MVVFILGTIILALLILLMLIIILCFIKINVSKLQISNYEDLKEIFKLIKEKDYASIFNYTDFIIKLQLCIFNKIPLISLKITNTKMKKILQKQLNRKITKQQKEKQKKEAKIILPEVKLEKLDLGINLGIEDAIATAMVATGMNIAISLVLPFVVDEPNREDYRYEVKPIYLSKEVFKMETSLVASLSILNLIKAFIVNV